MSAPGHSPRRSRIPRSLRLRTIAMKLNRDLPGDKMKKLIHIIKTNWKLAAIAVFISYVLYDLNQLHAELSHIENSDSLPETLTTSEIADNRSAPPDLYPDRSELDSVKTNMNTIRSDMDSVKSDVSSMASKLVDYNMRLDKISPTSEEVMYNSARRDFFSIKSEVNSIRANMNILKSEMRFLKSKVSTIESKLSSIDRSKRF